MTSVREELGPPEVQLYRPNSREEEAELSLKRTVFSRGVPKLLCAALLITILVVPLLQFCTDIRAARAGQNDPAARPTRRLFRAGDAFDLLPTVTQIREARGFWGYWHLLPARSRITALEDSLEEESVVGQYLLPQAQYALTAWLGAGNEQAYPGRSRWLFYRPEVEYLTGPGFLDPKALRSRSRSADVQPDPVLALVRFKQQLAARGIELIVVPAPAKPMIHPEMFSRSFARNAGPLVNASFAHFCHRLQQAGILVFDPAPVLAARKRHLGEPQFLVTDTHWTPEAMGACAQELADFIRTHAPLPPQPKVAYTRRPLEVENQGDLALMLKFPANSHYFPLQRVRIAPVHGPSGDLWRPSPDSAVLLLGDSFSNIYSLAGMGWGEGAGLAEQLSAELGRPLDRIVANAGGAFASRSRLCQELARGNDRLFGKKLVIYEFAARDLSCGDWKLLDLPTPKPTRPPVSSVASAKGTVAPEETSGQPSSGTAKPVAPIPPTPTLTSPEATGARATKPSVPPKPEVGKPLVVRGVIKSVAPTPKPGSVPYKDCVISIVLRNVTALQGTVKTTELLAYVWGMQDNRASRASGYRVGQTVTLTLTLWSKVEERYGGYNRVEPEDSEALLLDAYWGE